MCNDVGTSNGRHLGPGEHSTATDMPEQRLEVTRRDACQMRHVSRGRERYCVTRRTASAVTEALCCGGRFARLSVVSCSHPHSPPYLSVHLLPPESQQCTPQVMPMVLLLRSSPTTRSSITPQMPWLAIQTSQAPTTLPPPNTRRGLTSHPLQR